MSEYPHQSPAIQSDDNIVYYVISYHRDWLYTRKQDLNIKSYNKVKRIEHTISHQLSGQYLQQISAGKWGLILHSIDITNHILQLFNQVPQTLPELKSSYQLVLAYAQDKLFCFSGQIMPYFQLHELVHEPAFKYYDFKQGQWIGFQQFVNGCMAGPACTVNNQSIFARYLQKEKFSLIKFDIQRETYNILNIQFQIYQDVQMFGYENNIILISDNNMYKYDIETESKIEVRHFNLDGRIVAYKGLSVIFCGPRKNIFSIDF